MKFIHTADWHLGKLVHGVYMTEDQKYVLQELIELVRQEEPDALVIAGDLYDRSVPPTDAVNLLNDTLHTINVDLNIPIIAISGNHDSADRLSFGSSWYRQSSLFMTGKWQKGTRPITIKGVQFHCVPFSEPGLIREALMRDDITTHHNAMEAIVEEIKKNMDPSMHHVMVSHSFVLGGKTTDSERTLSVGGSGCVGGEMFEPFHYTALGHLHSPDAIKHKKIHYSGSLMKYSFSEANQRKVAKVVTIDPAGEVIVTERPLKPKRDMREIEGYLDELMNPSYFNEQKRDDYLKVTLLDEGALIDPMNQLRQIYPNILHLERKLAIRDQKKHTRTLNSLSEGKSDLALFKEFYDQITTSEWSESKEEKISSTMQSIRNKEGQA